MSADEWVVSQVNRLRQRADSTDGQARIAVSEVKRLQEEAAAYREQAAALEGLLARAQR